MHKKIIIFIFIIILLIILPLKPNRQNINIPILLYHDFVLKIPDEDPDNFNYINTPESFEENIKTLLKNGFTFLSFRDLNDAYFNKKNYPANQF